MVWDRLSDQPHQHAGRLARAGIRLSDLPQHLRAAAALAGALPRIRRRYRELAAQDAGALAPRAPFAWPEPGVALRPWPENPEALLAAFDRLGARRAMIRLHPWQERHDDEQALARALAARGVELTFTLPQNRELVRDPARWEAAIAELAASASRRSASASSSARRSTAASGGSGTTTSTWSSRRAPPGFCAARRRGRASSSSARRSSTSRPTSPPRW